MAILWCERGFEVSGLGVNIRVGYGDDVSFGLWAQFVRKVYSS